MNSNLRKIKRIAGKKNRSIIGSFLIVGIADPFVYTYKLLQPSECIFNFTHVHIANIYLHAFIVYCTHALVWLVQLIHCMNVYTGSTLLQYSLLIMNSVYVDFTIYIY